MHRAFQSIALFLITFGVATAASAQTPATQPAAPPLDSHTPLAYMTSYDSLAGQDPPAYEAMYFVNETDDVQRVVKVQAKFDSQVGMLQKIVQQKWGTDAADMMLHALGLKTLRDIQAADIKQAGRHASVVFADGTPGPELIRTRSGWRLDMPTFCESLGMPVDDYLKQIRQISNILPDVADGISGGKLKDPSAVVSDIAKRLNTTTHG